MSSEVPNLGGPWPLSPAPPSPQDPENQSSASPGFKNVLHAPKHPLHLYVHWGLDSESSCHPSLLGLPWQNITDGVALTRDIHSLTVLEARGPWSRCQQTWRDLLPAHRWPHRGPPSQHVFLCSLCTCREKRSGIFSSVLRTPIPLD